MMFECNFVVMVTNIAMSFIECIEGKEEAKHLFNGNNETGLLKVESTDTVDENEYLSAICR